MPSSEDVYRESADREGLTMHPFLIVVPGDIRKWRVELANGEHALDLVTTDSSRLDALYWTQINTPSEALMYSESGDLEKVHQYK
jgi:hypothetical protein